MRLKDRVIIVTGAGQGIGVAYAHRLSAEGAKVVVADINLNGVEKVAAEIGAAGGQALALKVDVTSPQETDAMAEETVNRFGRIDVLVNNAALFTAIRRAPFWEIEPEEFDRVMAVNIKGIWLCCKVVFPQMKKQGSGKIVNIASGIFWSAKPNMAHYVASKGGVVGLTRAMARELGDYNINVNAVAPGFTMTDITAVTVPQGAQSFDAGCFKRDERPQDLVGVVIFLSSNESDFMTGQTLVVDGGRVLY